MKIHDLTSSTAGERARISATVVWEESDRPSQEIFLETTTTFADELTLHPHVFLVAGVLPALYHGEKRVWIDGEVCPELVHNLYTAVSIIRHWYYEPASPSIKIEAKDLLKESFPPASSRAALFFSGGIDSLSTLRVNHLGIPRWHRNSIKDAIIIFGQNIESDNRPESFKKAFAELGEVAQDAGVRLIPIYTNVRSLEESSPFFEQYHGAILGALAHAFSKSISTFYVASTFDLDHLDPWGSHPILDGLYSSSSVQVKHVDYNLKRIEKTRIVSDWEAGLQNIKVCGPNWPSANCGLCEKCLRTELALVAVGKLDKTRAFPLDDLSADLIRERLRFKHHHTFFYPELLEPLRDIGRPDLASAVEDKLNNYFNPPGAESRALRFKNKVLEIDRKYLHGNLRRLKKAVIP